MVFPYAAVIAATNTIRRNNEEREKNRKEDNKKHDDIKKVRNIIVTYEDGSCRTIKHGISADVISEDNMILYHTNCTDEQFLSILGGLIQIGKDKGIIK